MKTSRISASRSSASRISTFLLLCGLVIGSAFARLDSVQLKATTLPLGFTEELVTGGLSSPTAMEFAPDGRLFVCEQGGTLRIVKRGGLLPTPFLQVTVDATGERGLLGVALDPNFSENRYVYIYYTATTPTIHNRVSRFKARGDVAVPGSERILLELDPLSSATNHNGGALHFGPDGRLYIAVGENANPANAQTLTNLLGKVLRINRNGSIPKSNPFYTTAVGQNRAIWALGLRNPFTFAVQPRTGRIFINDVGAGTWEEINQGKAGANYGWSTCEGSCSPPVPELTDPLFQYEHGSSNTTGCSIAGGAFYISGSMRFPSEYNGSYFFADLCNGWIRRFDPTTHQVFDFASGIPSSLVDLKVRAGALYYLAYGAGAIFRIRHTGSDGLTGASIVPSASDPSEAPSTETPSGEAPSAETPSTVTLSTAVALASRSRIRLTFSGALDGAVAADAEHYEVEVNGEMVEIESAAYHAASQTVMLSLPRGSLRVGDQVVVFWHDLRDAEGYPLSGRVGPLAAG
jgi:glucose/arabinose dehydrogenase